MKKHLGVIVAAVLAMGTVAVSETPAAAAGSSWGARVQGKHHINGPRWYGHRGWGGHRHWYGHRHMYRHHRYYR